MLTFEKVLEIFADYLTADETIEVYNMNTNMSTARVKRVLARSISAVLI